MLNWWYMHQNLELSTFSQYIYYYEIIVKKMFGEPHCSVYLQI
jgi:hypothetical protein